MSAPISIWRIRYDVLSTRLLLALTLAESRGDLRPDVHGFLADRYGRLAAYWRRAGWSAHAVALARKASRHAEAAGDEPPPAAAMGLPRRRRSVAVDARGRVLQGRWPSSRVASSR
jgi:hypothetical protein